MRKMLTLALCLMASASALAQEVSRPIAEAFNARKFYLKMAGQQTDQGFSVQMSVEIASRGDVSMSRMQMSDMNVVSLGTPSGTFMLDEDHRSFTAMPTAQGASPLPDKPLKLKRHGRCRLNGQTCAFDEYQSADGLTLSCYYRADKVAAIELQQGAMHLGPMHLQSFSTAIPSHMYFCVGTDWKGQGNIPRCSTPWHDTEPLLELACGTGNGRISIDGKEEGDTSDLAQAPAEAKADEYTEAGVMAAIDELAEEMRGMTDEQKCEHVITGSAEPLFDIATGQVTARTVERAIARCVICPHSLTYTNAGTCIKEVKGPEKAIPFFESAQTMSPDNPMIRAEIVDCYIRLGNRPKAETLSRQAIDRIPDSGMLWQQLACICLEKENYKEAARALCKSMALGYFDEASAMIGMALYFHVADQELENPVGNDFLKSLQEVFTEENLANLEKAAQCGHEDIHPEDNKPFNNQWNLIYGNVENANDAMWKTVDDHHSRADHLHNQAKDVVSSGKGEIYTMMGIDQTLHNLLVSQMRGDREGLILNLCDAREFYANYLIMLYYQAAINWLEGPQGKTPIAQRQAQIGRQEKLDDTLNRQLKANSDACTAEIDALKKASLITLYQINLNYAIKDYDAYKVWSTPSLASYRTYWNEAVAPMLDEYHRRTSLMSQYISDKELQRYFMDEMMSTMHEGREEQMSEGAGVGQALVDAHDRVEFYQKLIAELQKAQWKSEREAYLEHKRELQKDDDYYLHDFTEKERNDVGLEVLIGTGNACGRQLTFRFGSDGITLEILDKRSGHTTSFGSDGFSTRVNYLMAYDAKQAELRQMAFDHAQRAATARIIAETIAGKVPFLDAIKNHVSNSEKAVKTLYGSPINSTYEEISAVGPSGQQVRGMSHTRSQDLGDGSTTFTHQESVMAGYRNTRISLRYNTSSPLGEGVSIGPYMQKLRRLHHPARRSR